MRVPLLDAWTDWSCPNCTVTERTRPQPLTSARMHPCAKLHGLLAPLVPAGTDCKVTAEERGDYLRHAIQRTGDDGRPYMAVRTVHGDGREDLAVFAEVAIQAVRSY